MMALLPVLSLRMVFEQMKDEQILSELNLLLDLLGKQLEEFQTSYEKLQVALVGTLRLSDDDSGLLAHLQGDPEHLKSYLIRLCSNLNESTTRSYKHLREKIEILINSFT